MGTDHDTAAFALESIRRWWSGQGRAAYPQATRLLITADAGGSNGYRTRAWKLELARLAAETGLTITVCHLPPGTSKWNKIEHRLFSHITMNWRGRPLTSHEVFVQSIAATTTRTGLPVMAELDTNVYPTGVQIGDAEMASLPLTRHAFPDQVLAAVLHLRVDLAPEPLAVLFDSSRTAMHRTLLKIRTLLKAHSIIIPPSATPPSALTALQARVRVLSSDSSSMIKTTC